jgi:membrane peptidoglycan carboxypeptidase
MFIKTFKQFIALFFFGTLLTLGLAGGGAFYIYWQVKHGDYTQLKKSTILAMFQEETSLFYDDGKTRIGSIFESKHRRYVPVDEIPANMINALIAVEDKNFYHHFGVDPLAIASALFEGLSNHGQFRRGGSTLTQQTVKNIINDWEPSFSRKFREMVRALQLEQIYDKRQILEFYLNQFHVAGNGMGIDIAGRYYFDKDVKDLTLNEAAFIAGSVKGPGKYNPFIKFTKEDKERAKEFANERKNYVLAQMYDQGWITKEQYLENTKTPVPFQKGEFRTAEVSLVDLVQGQLQKKEVLDSLGMTNPDNLSIAGLKVFTTLDADMQRAAQLSMRRNLSRVETILTGFEPEAPESFKVQRDLRVNEFYFGKVIEIPDNTLQNASIKITFEGGPHGTIPTDSIIRYAKTLNLVDGRGYEGYFQKLMSKIHVGNILFVEVLSYNKDTNEAVLELHKRPVVSGGLIALDKGEVRAIVSGFDTLGYNRAVTAKKQAGSSFKTEVFFGALQLGWSILDKLDNSRQIFPYQGRFYFPRPDHFSPYETTSMIWAGVKSENLASVHLTAHLLDKIDFDQFKQLLSIMNLTPHPSEAPRDYHYRVAKQTGVSLDDDGVESFQLTNAVNDLAPDLVFGGDDSLLKRLKKMWWGYGYIHAIERVHGANGDEYTQKEKKIRHDLLLNNYIRMSALQESLNKDFTVLQGLFDKNPLPQVLEDPVAKSILSNLRVLTEATEKKLAYFIRRPEETSIATLHHPIPEIIGTPVTLTDLEDFLKDKNFTKLADNVWIDGDIPSSIIANLRDLIAKHVEDIRAKQSEDPYRLYSYYQHHDFRIALGLEYLVKLSHASGVQNPLEPVLSFPLGANDVTTSEVARLYQTFTAGKVYKFYQDGPDNQISFIKRIEDRFGNVLYETTRKETQIVAPAIAQQVREILRRVVTHGTGRRARGELYVNAGGGRQVRVPAYGKTGTTNDYKISYFAGFLPYPTERGKALDPENSYTVATYVGYDLNKLMVKGAKHIGGSDGGLPIWTEFLKEVISIKKYADYLDPNIQNEWPLLREQNTGPYLVELPSGSVVRSGADSEAWKTTNFSVTGEEYVNYFDTLDTPNTTNLNLPPDPNQRVFSIADFVTPRKPPMVTN